MQAVPMKADTGPIGGDLSHEFIVLAADRRERGLLRRGLVDDRRAASRDHRLRTATCSRSSTSARRPTPRPTRRTTRPRFEADPRGRAARPGAASRSATSSISATNIPSRWAVVAGPDGEPVTSRWAATASACRGWSARSSRRAMTKRASSGPKRGAVQRRRSSTCARRRRDVDARCERALRRAAAAGVEVLYDDRDEPAGRQVRRSWT